MPESKSNRFTKYFPLLLDALRTADPAPMKPSEVRDWIGSRASVSPEDLSRKIENGEQSIFENDVHWARFYLTKAGLLSGQKRGFWSLTPAGRVTFLTPETTWELYVRVRDANRPGATNEEASMAPSLDELPNEGPSFWFAGAFWGDSENDQTERFLTEGIWENGYDDKFTELVTQIRPGDKIAIKASFVMKHGLPFDIAGQSASCMKIKATGTVTGNRGDGKTVTVDWDPPSEPRVWYFYTYRSTLVKADTEAEEARLLIDFCFNSATQDYSWWLAQPYWAQKYGTAGHLLLPAIAETDDREVLEETFTERNTASYTLDDIRADGSFLELSFLSEVMKRWREKKNLILQGPPGTGKTFLAKRLGYVLIGSKDRETTRSRLRVVQFHPSLSYEDFVRGWRPTGKDGLALVDGIFMQAIAAAASEPDREYVLVIEEINRGNPAQIFGELLTLIESGKRRRDEAIELAYRKTEGEQIFVPNNLYIIGTMNVADRSLALVDLALRRRFGFVDLQPTLGPAWSTWCQARGLSQTLTTNIQERIETLNSRISSEPGLGPQFRIGHSYVTPDERVLDGNEWFRSKVETEIGPLLDEYWYDAPEQADKARRDLVEGL